MSNLAHPPSGDDFPAAAGKHLDDAKLLVDGGRYDNGGYLAGYVVECSLKTLIIVGEIARAISLTPTTSMADAMRAPDHKVGSGIDAGYKTARKIGHDIGTLSRKAMGLAALPRRRDRQVRATARPGVCGLGAGGALPDGRAPRRGHGPRMARRGTGRL